MYSRELPVYNRKISGLSLIELMVALVISSVLMLGLVAAFKNSSDSQKQLQRAGDLIENGRYAISVLRDDISTAGYFGYYYDDSNPPTTLADPCATSTSDLTTAIKMPIEGYTAASLTQTILSNSSFDASKMTCDDKGLFTSANLSPGSDVLVIRRADTEALNGVPVNGQIYIQANTSQIKVMKGDSGAGTVNNTSSRTANEDAQSIRKYPKATTSPDNTYWADVRKYHVDVYFVAPCVIGSGTNGVCTAADATNSKNNIPTLKRLELTASGGSTIMQIVPLVEGVEYFKVEYGLDTVPSTVNATTNLIGDSIPDSYVTSPTPSQWADVVSVRIYMLVRATDKTDGYVDSKSYTLGTVSGGTVVAAANDAYNRHVFSAEVRPMDLAGRREIPE